MRLSARTALEGGENSLTKAVRLARQRRDEGGARFLDLTTSNPTKADLPYPSEAILEALSSPQALRYRPDAMGLEEARAAVARHWRTLGAEVCPNRIALTSSTSEAYAVLFKMLADPGDELLVPEPSYPLLGYLAAFEAVRLVPYPLVYAGSWHVDLDALRSRIGPKTRGIVVISPNNPTGSYLGRHELAALLDTGLPIVSDEVFAPYPLTDAVPDHRVGSVLEATRGLVFALSGLSKLAALPQMKLGWIGVAGDPELVTEATARLDFILDAYLSPGAPVQHGAAPLLEASAITRDAIRQRTRRNLSALRRAVANSPISVLDVEGGWYATLRVPETRSDEAWAEALVTNASVFVHPGYFFDMHRGAHLVVSLLTPEATFDEGIARLGAFVTAG